MSIAATASNWTLLVHPHQLGSMGVPSHSTGGMPEAAWIRIDTGLIIAVIATGGWREGGEYQTWCIPPGGSAVQMTPVGKFRAGDTEYHHALDKVLDDLFDDGVALPGMGNPKWKQHMEDSP